MHVEGRSSTYLPGGTASLGVLPSLGGAFSFLVEAALRSNAGLRIQAERLIAAYVAPESERPTIVNELITLFDGPQQRKAPPGVTPGPKSTGGAQPVTPITPEKKQ